MDSRKQLKTYCLHGLNERVVDYILGFPKDSLVFFDDGLASLYTFKSFLMNYKDVKFIIGVNPWIALKAGEEKNIDIDYIKCAEAHNLVKTKQDFSHYLNSKMIKELSLGGCEIADHSWDHFIFEKRTKGLKAKTEYYKDIINKSKDFYNVLDIHPTKYIRPYNRENQVYEILVKKILDIKDIYGAERINGPWNSYY